MINLRHAKINILCKARQGDAQSQYELACLYRNGDHACPPNYLVAARWLEEAAKQNHIDAMRALASLYERGLGVEKDLNKAKRLYEEILTLSKVAKNDRRPRFFVTEADLRRIE